MTKLRLDNKGVALFFVLATLLIVVILANVILGITLSQSRLTHHQVSRIQGYYAAQAGINYALEKLRLNNDTNWPSTGTYSCTMCRSGCSGGCNIVEANLPLSVKSVLITVGNPGSGINGTRSVNATVDYSYP